MLLAITTLGRAMALQDAATNGVREEIADGLDARLGRTPRDIDGRIDTQHPHAALLEEAEQRSVVAAELDDQRARRDPEAADDVVGIAREMLPQAERQRGGVDVVAVLDLRITDMENLEVPAVPAQMQRHRHRGPEDGIVDAGVRHLEVRRANRACRPSGRPALACRSDRGGRYDGRRTGFSSWNRKR